MITISGRAALGHRYTQPQRYRRRNAVNPKERNRDMALFGKLVTLAKAPQGRKLLVQAQKAARDPQNRERLEKARSKIQNRGAATANHPASQERPRPDGDRPESESQPKP
jgi:hypothetical protein